MKVCRWLVLCVFSVSASAAVLTPSPGVSILYINGQASESKVGKNNLPEGEVQIIVRMDKNLGKGSNSKVFTSDPYILNLVVSGEEFNINHPVARSFQEAEKAFRSGDPKWKFTQDGMDVNYTQDPLPKKKGLFPFMGMEKTISDYNEDKGIFFVDGVLTEATVAPAS
ncbi:DUF2057 family protein, partial [Vibrio genomosp. F10]|uniref:DUF2057 family protein n=1 Tax=Vibrio genomosp. F10 TaxID=723171 RepID=UPI00084C6D8E